jgi:hypothetical protein
MYVTVKLMKKLSHDSWMLNIFLLFEAPLEFEKLVSCKFCCQPLNSSGSRCIYIEILISIACGMKFNMNSKVMQHHSSGLLIGLEISGALRNLRTRRSFIIGSLVC